MRTTKKVAPKKERPQSYLLTDEQLQWLENLYPYFDNLTLSKRLFKHWGIEMSPKSIKNMAYRRMWHKDDEYISDLRNGNARGTNNKRWGTPL